MTKPEFVEIFDMLYSACRHYPSPKAEKVYETRAKVYWRLFKKYPASSFERGVMAYLEEETSPEFPMPASISIAMQESYVPPVPPPSKPLAADGSDEEWEQELEEIVRGFRKNIGN